MDVKARASESLCEHLKGIELPTIIMSTILSICRRAVENFRLVRKHRLLCLRMSSSAGSVAASLRVDPSRLIDGLTKEKIERDPSVAEFLKANFPEAFVDAFDASSESYEEAGAQDEKSSSQDAEAYPRNIRPLSCYRRDPEEEKGKSAIGRLRWDGMIPGIVYGTDPTLGIRSHQPESKFLVKTEWKLLQRELDLYHRHFESRVYDLTVFVGPDDKTGTLHRVIPRNVNRHPVKNSIFCANFCRYYAGRPIKLPITYVNEEESPALKRDGFIIPLQRFVECFIEDGADIPNTLEVECTGLLVKDLIRLDRVILPDGVRYSDRTIKRGNQFIIGVVSGKGRDPAESEDEDEDEED